jgi:hypothetical protein
MSFGTMRVFQLPGACQFVLLVRVQVAISCVTGYIYRVGTSVGIYGD